MISEKVTLGNLGMDLVYEPNPLTKRLRALSQLQSIATVEDFTQETIRSTKAIAAGLFSESLLVKHKCVFALGQSRFPTVVPDLREQLMDTENDIGSRVQAARGLALLRYPGQEIQTICDLLGILYGEEDGIDVLRSAAEVAAARLGWEKSGEEVVVETWNGTVDFAPPFSYVPDDDPVQYFSSILRDTSESLFSQCRAISNLRNLCLDVEEEEDPSHQYMTMMIIQSLTQVFQTTSSVFLRYQLILALGQIKHKMVQMFLIMQLQNTHGEKEIVRAAAAEALALTGDERVVSVLRGFSGDESVVVRECVKLAVERAAEENAENRDLNDA